MQSYEIQMKILLYSSNNMMNSSDVYQFFMDFNDSLMKFLSKCYKFARRDYVYYEVFQWATMFFMSNTLYMNIIQPFVTIRVPKTQEFPGRVRSRRGAVLLFDRQIWFQAQS